MKFKRSLCLTLAVTLVLGLIPNRSMASNRLPFNDVNVSDEHYPAIQYVYERDIMNGVGDGKFSADALTTRGQLVTVLHRMAGAPKVSGEHFSDIKPGAFYEEGVRWASQNQIVNGYGNGEFKPDNIITREELLTIFHRYAKHCGIGTENMTIFSSYEDSHRVSLYAFEPINWALHYGLISAEDHRIRPRKLASRGEIAHVIYQYLESAAKAELPRLNETVLNQQLKGVWKVTGIYRDEFDRDYEDFYENYDYFINLQIRFADGKYQIFTPHSDDYTVGDYQMVGYDPAAEMVKLKIREEGLYDIDYVDHREDYFYHNSRFHVLGLTVDMEEPVLAIDTNTYYKVELLDEDHMRLYFSDNKVLDCTYLGDFNPFGEI